MRNLHLRLPEQVYEQLERAAKDAGVRVEEYAVTLIARELPPSRASNHAVTTVSEKQTEASTIRLPPPAKKLTFPLTIADLEGTQRATFNLKGKFPGVSFASIAWAQKFVDAALLYEGVRPFQNGEGVGFNPNFVFIERIYTYEDGFIASFFGSPYEFRTRGIRLEDGRHASYSRLRIKSPFDLNTALSCIPISAQRKGLRPYR